MDLFKIFSEIEKVDPEVYERFDTRRSTFKYLSNIGKTVTAAAVPAMLSTMFQKAYGQTTLPTDIANTLNLALQLEYLERHFYQRGIDAGIVPAADLPAITIIRDDEIGHINALKLLLGAQAFNGGNDPTAAAFDYTAGGKLTPFVDAANFYSVGQSFVDTGVRAYKGGAPKLMPNPAILTAALNIHSVEARHSSHLRMLRRGGIQAVADVANLNAKPKSWISGTDNGGPKPDVTAPVYGAGSVPANFPADDNLVQGGLNVRDITVYPTSLTLTADQRTAAASEAFDEPLDDVKVKEIARNFRSAAGIALGLFA